MACLAPKEIIEFISGAWQLTRTVSPAIAYQPYKAHGTATFEPSLDNPFSLEYVENVVSTIYVSEGTQSGSKSYRYVLDPITNTVSKFFEDGRLFYTLTQADQAICGDHLCINDTYKANYSFDKNSFTITYTVQGPAKDYIMTTVYTRSISD